jgi:SagB-type dehydrogenase family enzyme
VVDRDGRTLDIAAYLYEESSYSRAGMLRAVGLAPPRPSDVKEYAGLPRVRLPSPRSRAGGSLAAALAGFTRASGSETPVPAASLGLQELADIAFHGAGVTDGSEGSGMRFRAAASSGALYPTDLYVLVRSIAGLEPGAYYYDPHAHVLVRTAAASALDAVLRASDAGSAGTLPWAFVLGATYDRTVSKYNIRSCRYLPLDAGHLAVNLVLSASVLGHQLVADTWFDDGLVSRELGLEPDVEAPLLVIRGGTPRAHPPPRRRRNLPSDLATGELTRLAHELTSWELAAEANRHGHERAPQPLPELVRGFATVSLGAAEPASGDLFEIARRRRSFRAFARGAVRIDDVASVLATSTSLLPSVRGGAIVEPYLLVRAVRDLEPGVYRYDAGHSALQPLSRGDRSRDIERAGLDQELLGRAAFVIAWSFAPERLGRLDGARDFRTAGLAAGFAGEVAYLTAGARGLGICGVGAFYDADVNALVPADTARVIYLMGVGARA